MRRLCVAMMLAACLACAPATREVATTIKAEPPISVTVSPKFAIGRASVRLVIRMAESPDNRMLRYSIDGPNYVRVSQEDWSDGILLSPKVLSVIYESVPEGQYVAQAILYRANGQTYQAYDTFCLTGPTTDCQDNAR